MTDSIQEKIEKINKLLRDAGMPLKFGFGSYDLKKYEPFLNFTVKDPAVDWFGTLCTAVSENHVVFFFREFPLLKRADNYEEYKQNLKQIQQWEMLERELNAIKVEVPRYI